MPSILTVIRKEFILLILIYNMQDPAFPRCCLSKWSGLQELFANSSFLPLSPLSSIFFHRIPVSRTLGARAFSCAVSGFGQVLKSDTREAPHCSREKTSGTQGTFRATLYALGMICIRPEEAADDTTLACEQAFPFPFSAFFPQTESLFTG